MVFEALLTPTLFYATLHTITLDDSWVSTSLDYIQLIYVHRKKALNNL